MAGSGTWCRLRISVAPSTEPSGQRQLLRAAEQVAVVGVALARTGDRILGDLDPDRLRSGAGERAHEAAVAAADVDDDPALQVDRVRQLLEVAHALSVGFRA